MALDLMELCLGHPHCVSAILDHFKAGPRFDKNKRLANWRQLQTIVWRIVEAEILKEAANSVKGESSRVFFALRRIGPDQLMYLRDDADLAPYYDCLESATTTNTNVIWADLTHTYLVTSREHSILGAYTTDPVARYFVTEHLLQVSEQRYSEIHRSVLQFYEDRIRDQHTGPQRITLQVGLIQEALYHLCRLLLVPPVDFGRNRQEIISKVSKWMEDWQSSDVAPIDFKNNLQSVIQEDSDLSLLLRRVGGPDCCDDLFDLIANLSVSGQSEEDQEAA